MPHAHHHHSHHSSDDKSHPKRWCRHGDRCEDHSCKYRHPTSRPAGGPILGVDFGGVLVVSAERDTGDTSFFSDKYLLTPEEVGAAEWLNRLQDHFDAVHIVSKAHSRTAEKSREWMEARKFVERSKVNSVTFVEERADKRGVCERLGITHFVDDHIGVLQLLEGAVAVRIAFRPSIEDVESHQHVLKEEGVKVVDSWEEAGWLLMKDVGGPST